MLKILSPQINAMLGKDTNPEIWKKYYGYLKLKLKRFFTSWRGICVIILLYEDILKNK